MLRKQPKRRLMKGLYAGSVSIATIILLGSRTDPTENLNRCFLPQNINSTFSFYNPTVRTAINTDKVTDLDDELLSHGRNYELGILLSYQVFCLFYSNQILIHLKPSSNFRITNKWDFQSFRASGKSFWETFSWQILVNLIQCAPRKRDS